MAFLQLFAHENHVLLVRWDTLLVLDSSFDIPSGVTGLDLRVMVLPGRVYTKICKSVLAGRLLCCLDQLCIAMPRFRPAVLLFVFCSLFPLFLFIS